MPKNLNITNAIANSQATQVSTALNNGYLRIYDGTQPATADTAISGQTLLAELRFNATAFGAPVNGVLTANAIAADTSANATGTATWFRALGSDGTTVVFDGTVGVSGSGTHDLEFTGSASITAGTEVQVNSLTYTVTK